MNESAIPIGLFANAFTDSFDGSLPVTFLIISPGLPSIHNDFSACILR
jgi:hypothetical protein